MKLKDVLFLRHRENNDREFFLTIKIKREDITLEEKEQIRDAVEASKNEGKTYDFEWQDGEATTQNIKSERAGDWSKTFMNDNPINNNIPEHGSFEN